MTTSSSPTASALGAQLEQFFADAGGRVAARTRARYERVHARLLRFLEEVDVTDLLGSEPQAVLAMERQFGRTGAFQRLHDPEEFVCCLPVFLSPDWLLPDPADARSQVVLTERLTRQIYSIYRYRLRTCSCTFNNVYTAATTARRRFGP
ncbi:hypothetical protein [Microlunatus speluncae]|uniref:hypothetical protein n=1 Tax=Microlunatus speluncae TaxID=2594267 RepID=UPI0012663847|nr:hypothetical protein [Microlunatus speluncae]